MSTTDVNAFLMAGGVPSAKFPSIGTVVKGSIVSSEVNQQTDFTSNTPKFYDDGKPMMQAVITLQTDERDPEIDGDDGLRKLYVRGQMLAAVREAIRAAKADLEVGGILAVQYASDKASDKRGFNPAKQYVAEYQAPAPGTGAANDLIAGAAAAPAETPAAPQPTASSLI